MKQINSPHDFAALLEADRAVLFIFFPWSDRSVQSQKIVAEWQSHAPSDSLAFQLAPDDRSFTWQWLDTIFGDEPEP